MGISLQKSSLIIHLTSIATGLGTMIAAASEQGVCLLVFADSKCLESALRQVSETFNAPLVHGDSLYLHTLKEQLAQYFQGERREFTVPLHLAGTAFQKQVWLSLQRIPYGTTATYAAQAALIGHPAAVRAVANANGKNKINLLLPCHRVIGANGAFTGYNGGIGRKRQLLELEKQTGNVAFHNKPDI